jgi:hypothetical protein
LAIANSKLLLDSPHSPEYFYGQFPLGWNSGLGCDGFKIAQDHPS